MFVYAVVLLCALGLAAMVYRYDMYEREPWYMLLLALVIGGAAGFGVGHLEDFTIHAIGSAAETTAGSAAIAATHEELAKLICVILIAQIFRKQFNDPMDGIIYGSFIGLGMAIEESLFYLSLEAAPNIASGREAVRLVLHLLMGGMGGFGLGMARFHMRLWPAALALFFGCALAIHFCWDAVIPLTYDDDVMAGLQQASAVALMVGSIVIYGTLVAVASRWSRAEFAADSAKRLWAWPFSLWLHDEDSCNVGEAGDHSEPRT